MWFDPNSARSSRAPSTRTNAWGNSAVVRESISGSRRSTSPPATAIQYVPLRLHSRAKVTFPGAATKGKAAPPPPPKEWGTIRTRERPLGSAPSAAKAAGMAPQFASVRTPLRGSIHRTSRRPAGLPPDRRWRICMVRAPSTSASHAWTTASFRPSASSQPFISM